MSRTKDTSIDLTLPSGVKGSIVRERRDRRVAQVQAAMQREHLRNLKKSNAELERTKVELTRLAMRDKLTGIYNRHALEAFFIHMNGAAARTGGVLCGVLLDVDKFKPFNDEFGHETGDEALKHVAQILKENMKREGDVYGRWGGEEFCCFFVCADQEAGLELAEKLRMALESKQFSSGRCNKPLTASFGVAFEDAHGGLTLKGLMNVADKALYRAKELGRNRVVYQAADGQKLEHSCGTITYTENGFIKQAQHAARRVVRRVLAPLMR